MFDTPIETTPIIVDPNDYSQMATYGQTENSGSSKYDHVKTGDIIETIVQSTDFKVTDYKEAYTRKADNKGKQTHLVRLTSESLKSDEGALQICLYNSYDCTKAFRIFVGYIRWVCLNGMIAGTAINDFSQKHVNFDYNNLNKFLGDIPILSQEVNENIDRMQNTILTDSERRDFAMNALELRGLTDSKRFKEQVEGTRSQDYLLDNLLKSRQYRQEDRGNDVWKTFNVLQENLVRGKKNFVQSVREVKSPASIVKLNRGLWDLAIAA